MSGPRVHNGHEWLPVPVVGTTSSEKPVEPILDGDGKIFVSIVSYRGTSTVHFCTSSPLFDMSCISLQRLIFLMICNV